MIRKALMGAVLLVLTLSLTGLAQVGEKAPKIEAGELLNTTYKKTDELKGKLVLVEFFAYW